MKRLLIGGPGLSSMVLLFAIWEIVARLKLLNPIVFPTFTRVIEALYSLAAGPVLWENVGASLQRAVTGFILASVLGIALGLAIGWSRTANAWLAAPLEFFRQLPPLAMLPVFLLILGLGFKAQIAMVIWAAIWPIMLNTANGCREVDPALIKAARSFGMNRMQMFTKLVLPSSLPMISTGLRLGGTYALLVLVGAEMVGAQSGIGYLIINSQYTLQVPEMYAGILTVAALGLLLNVALLHFEAWMSRWRDNSPPGS